MEFYFFYLDFFPFQAINKSFIRHEATHILRKNVYDKIICAMRQNYPENSLVIITVYNLKDLLSTW
jgi:hypothetical protein